MHVYVLPRLGSDRLRIIASIHIAILQLAGMFSKKKKKKNREKRKKMQH